MILKTLVIYDNNGKIYSMSTGDYIVPSGLQYIEVVVPDGKYITGVNVETQEAIFEDIPRSERDIIQEKISILETENADLLLDRAIKDIKIERLENDIADILIEIVGGM